MAAQAKRYMFLLFLPFMLSGCSTAIRGRAIVRPQLEGHSRDIAIAELPRIEEPKNLTYLGNAAVMSAAVYVDAPLSTRLDVLKKEGKPEERAQLALFPDDWIDDTAVPRTTPLPGQRQTPDLTYRLFVSPEGQGSRVALLAFRGTHIKADWYSNLRWIDSWIPGVEDHYEQTERITRKIIDYVKTKYGAETLILATGHSLGGGLAQTAAYTSCGDIPTVFAFDSTPITKHRARNVCDREQTSQTFYRVFEQSEILSYARFIVRLVLGLSKSNPQIVEVKVHLFNGIFVSAHSMQNLSERLDVELNHPVAQSLILRPPLGVQRLSR